MFDSTLCYFNVNNYELKMIFKVVKCFPIKNVVGLNDVLIFLQS